MALHSKPVRIRLFFEEPGMLSKEQVDQGLARSWYLVREDILIIGHLAARIEHDYRLGASCTQGLMLEMRGFVLPTGQSVRILQDSDLVRVRRMQERVSGIQERTLITNSLSVDNEEIDHAYRIGRGGLLAVDDFDKEAGGYQGELSDEDAEFSLSSGKNTLSALDGRKRLMVQESSGKKRKRSLRAGSPVQNNLFVSTPALRVGPEGLDSEPLKVKKQKALGKKKHDKVVRGERGSLPGSEHIDGGIPAISEKKKKKKKRELIEQAGLDVHCVGMSPGNEANAQEALPGKRRKVTSLKETATPENPAEIEPSTQKLKPKSSHKGETSKKRHDRIQDTNETELLQEKSEAKEKHGSPLSDNIALKQADSGKKRPSRSARRKKAKRKWLRECGQNGLVPKKDDATTQKKQQIQESVPKDGTDSSGSDTSEDEAEAQTQQTQRTDLKDGTDTSGSETSEDESEAKGETETEEEAEVEAKAEAEVDVGAEEEILPRMLAPGHIRFEHVEDARDEGQCATPVLLSYPEVHCKKQGQAWGQGKSRGRYSEDSYNRSGKMESRLSEWSVEQPRTKGVDFGRLPLLSRTPWVGDLLAYQLVELTSSWTPELSSYRVGKVALYDNASTMITLAPVAEYPIYAEHPEDEDGSLNEDIFLPPYNSDGMLQVSLTTLMEIRVVEAGPVQANGHSHGVPDANATTFDHPISSVHDATASEVPAELVQVQAPATGDDTHTDHTELRTNGNTAGSALSQEEPMSGQSTDAGWQDILSQEIMNKKLELSLKAGKELEGQNGDGPAPVDGEKKSSNQIAAVGNGKRTPRVIGAPIIRHRYMRTGALGPTMALLRASQNL